MPYTAARIRVDHVYEFTDGRRSVTDNVARYAFGDGYQLVIDHKHAMVKASDETLCYDGSRTSLLDRNVKCFAHLQLVGEIDADTSTVVRVERLDDLARSGSTESVFVGAWEF